MNPRSFLSILISTAVIATVILSNSGGTLANQATSSDEADELAFEIEIIDTEPQTKVAPGTFEFDRPAIVEYVDSIYCCFSGSITLSLKDKVVNEQTKALHHCKHCSNDSEGVHWVMPPRTIADKIVQHGALANGSVRYIDILGTRLETITLADLTKPIERLVNLVDTVGVEDKIAISSLNPEVLVWVGKKDDYIRKETSVFTDKVYACADTDVDGKCDYLALACSDGIDNDGNGKIDHPEDIGCESPLDDDETDPPACQDEIDNDGDGVTDFPDDPGCDSADDRSEGNPACNDTKDNDNDGRTDFPEDPGCDDLKDDSETSPECADGKDNDEDGAIDFPDDRGCTELKDSDERNVIIQVPVTLQQSKKPLLKFLPALKPDERLKIVPPCNTCEISSEPDYRQFIGGRPDADAGFTSIVTIHDTSDNSLNHIILAVGDHEDYEGALFDQSGSEYANAK